MEAVVLYAYKMRNLTQIIFNFTNILIKNVVLWFADILLHKWYILQIIYN